MTDQEMKELKTQFAEYEMSIVNGIHPDKELWKYWNEKGWQFHSYVRSSGLFCEDNGQYLLKINLTPESDICGVIEDMNFYIPLMKTLQDRNGESFKLFVICDYYDLCIYDDERIEIADGGNYLKDSFTSLEDALEYGKRVLIIKEKDVCKCCGRPYDD